MTISQADELKPCTAESPSTVTFTSLVHSSPLPVAFSSPWPAPPALPPLPHTRCTLGSPAPAVLSSVPPPLTCQPWCPCHRPPSPSRRGHIALYAFTLLCTTQHPPPPLDSSHNGVRSNFIFSPPQCPWMPVKGRKWGWGGLRKSRREARRVKD